MTVPASLPRSTVVASSVRRSACNSLDLGIRKSLENRLLISENVLSVLKNLGQIVRVWSLLDTLSSESARTLSHFRWHQRAA